MQILVTGGAGYIGTHTCVALLEAGHNVIIIDNLSNSESVTLHRIRQITNRDITFYQIDVTNDEAVNGVFLKHPIDAVIHFAGKKSVSESVVDPLQYYFNNVVGTILLAKACRDYGVKRFVYSSSATVYGENCVPFVETMKLMPTKSAYGESKVISERVLIDMARADSSMMIVILRYFNPIGAHESGLIGETTKQVPNNVMPYITQVAKGKLGRLKVFGGDYSTADGTGVRDYIHVMDLAEGHVASLIGASEGARIYNLGTGRGVSVLQLLRTFEIANGIRIPYEIVGRRPGDIGECIADVSKANKELGWAAQRNIHDMCRDAWHYEKGN